MHRKTMQMLATALVASATVSGSVAGVGDRPFRGYFGGNYRQAKMKNGGHPSVSAASQRRDKVKRANIRKHPRCQ